MLAWARVADTRGVWLCTHLRPREQACGLRPPGRRDLQQLLRVQRQRQDGHCRQLRLLRLPLRPGGQLLNVFVVVLLAPLRVPRAAPSSPSPAAPAYEPARQGATATAEGVMSRWRRDGRKAHSMAVRGMRFVD